MELFTINNPTSIGTTVLELPTDSVVYIGIKNTTLKDLFFPSIYLSGDWDINKKEFDYEAEGVVRLNASIPIMRFNQSIVCNRLWTGFEPYEKSFTAIINGYDRTIDGETELSTTRYDFIDSKGNSYLWDYASRTEKIYIDYVNNNSLDLSAGTALGILRDTEENYLGCCTYWNITSYAVKQGNRTTFYTGGMMSPSTAIGFYPIDEMPYKQIGIDEWKNTKEKVCVLSSMRSVEISDCPNITYTRHPTMNFNMHISCKEKSYSIIQF